MEKIRSKKVKAVLILLSVVISACLIFVAQYSVPVSMNGHKFTEDAFVNNNVGNLTEQKLQKQGITDLEVLRLRLDSYVNDLNTSSNDNRTAIMAKIAIVEDAIAIYDDEQTTFNNSSGIRQVSNVSTNSKVNPNCTCINSVIIAAPKCLSCIEYDAVKAEVMSIGVGFDVRGWALAADLIWHNLANTDYDSDYWPSRGDSIIAAPQMVEIAQNNLLTESNGQDSPGRLSGLFESTIEGDMYNSLGSFYYSKKDGRNGNVNIDIIDRYDWAHLKDGGSASVFNNTLAKAQDLGIVTPFYTRINLTMPGYVPFDWEYTDAGVKITDVASNITNAEIPATILDLRIKPGDGVAPPNIEITSIGAGAFANKANLTSMSFPNSITSIGASAFGNCTNLTTLSSLHNIQSIGEKAFKNCSSLVSINLPNSLTNIGDESFNGCGTLENVTIPASVTNIGERAFINCNNLNVSVASSNPNYSAEGNILYNKDRTELIGAYNTDSVLVLPSSLNSISAFAFYNNLNVFQLTFKNNIKIGENAFAGCRNMNSIFFYSYSAPQVEPNSLLNNPATVYVPYDSQTLYKTAFNGYKNSIDSIEVQVNFISDGSTMSTKNVHYGETISNILTPTKTGNNFKGWYDNASFTGKQYKNEEKWEITSSINLHAKWEAQKFNVSLNANGGAYNGVNTFEVVYGNTFLIPNVPMQYSMPERAGHTFEGWYDSQTGGAKYITEAGQGTRTWDKTSSTTLYARWAIKSYEIKINDNGTITWLGANGLSNVKCSIEYGTVLTAINLVPTFKATQNGYKEGKIFDHFEFNNQIINWNSVPDFGDNGAIITITPVWILEMHTIYFNTQTPQSIAAMTQNYGTFLILPNASAVGRVFNGWYTSSTGGTKINWTSMPDLTPLNGNDYNRAQNNGSIQVYAQYSYINYIVTFDKKGGSGGTDSIGNVRYNFSMPLATAPTKTGYNFQGYYAQQNGGGVKYYASNMTSATNWDIDNSVTLHAYWLAQVYNIKYMNVGTGNNSIENPNTYTIDTQDINLKTPTKEGFEGKWDIVSIRKGNTGDKTVTAQWTPITKPSITSGNFTSGSLSTKFGAWRTLSKFKLSDISPDIDFINNHVGEIRNQFIMSYSLNVSGNAEYEIGFYINGVQFDSRTKAINSSNTATKLYNVLNLGNLKPTDEIEIRIRCRKTTIFVGHFSINNISYKLDYYR